MAFVASTRPVIPSLVAEPIAVGSIPTAAAVSSIMSEAFFKSSTTGSATSQPVPGAYAAPASAPKICSSIAPNELSSAATWTSIASLMEVGSIPTAAATFLAWTSPYVNVSPAPTSTALARSPGADGSTFHGSTSGSTFHGSALAAAFASPSASVAPAVESPSGAMVPPPFPGSCVSAGEAGRHPRSSWSVIVWPVPGPAQGSIPAEHPEVQGPA